MSSLSEPRLFRLQFYLTAAYPCSYLSGRSARSQVAVPGSVVDAVVYGELVRLGFRRSGQHVYRPRCDACQACVPVRLAVAEFTPSRSQRRCMQRNADLAVRLLPLTFDEAHYRLYQRYQRARHAGGAMDQDDREQYRSFLLHSRVDSALLEFSLAGAVVMVALVDRLPDGLSAVYTFFDPRLSSRSTGRPKIDLAPTGGGSGVFSEPGAQLSSRSTGRPKIDLAPTGGGSGVFSEPGAQITQRSLGVYGVLYQVGLARELGLAHLYLGYWIRDCRKMAYKRDYRPLQGFLDGRWRSLDAPAASPGAVPEPPGPGDAHD